MRGGVAQNPHSPLPFLAEPRRSRYGDLTDEKNAESCGGSRAGLRISRESIPLHIVSGPLII